MKKAKNLKEATHIALWIPMSTTVSQLSKMAHSIGKRMTIETEKGTMKLVMISKAVTK